MNINFHVFIDNFVSAIEAKDGYTAGHSDRVADLSMLICRALKLEEHECHRIHMAAHLHDIGKIGIADGILLKSGKLNKFEYEVMKTHSEIGYNIIKNNNELKEISYMILYHHERYDGKGYPTGLQGADIPLGARIIAVADAFDAMVTKRTYKEKMTIFEAINEIEESSGSQFDAKVAETFIELLRKPNSRLQIVNLIS